MRGRPAWLLINPPGQTAGPMTKRDWIDNIGAFGLFVFSTGLAAGTGLLAWGQMFMELAFVLSLPLIWRSLLRDRLFILSIAFYVYLLAYACLVSPAAGVEPVLRGGGLDDFLRTGFLTTVVAAFWWVKFHESGRFSWPVWGFVLGFHIRLLTNWPLEDWSHGVPWKLGFGLYYNPFGMFCALVLAWWLVLLLRPDSGRGVRRTVAIAVAALIPLLGLIYSASRGAVVAFLAALLVMLVLWLRDRRDNLFSWKRIGAGAAAVAVLAFVIVNGPVAKRDPQALGEIGRILEQGVGQYVPQEYSSIGTRVVIWREGTRLWLEKPWFGHGPGPTEASLAELKSRYRLFDSFDFENTYLELLVRIGLVGTLFFAFHLFLCGQSFRRGLVAGWYPPDAGRFLLLACVIFGVALFFREGLLELRGRNVATFLLAGLYSFQVANRAVTKTEPDAEPA